MVSFEEFDLYKGIVDTVYLQVIRFIPPDIFDVVSQVLKPGAAAGIRCVAMGSVVVSQTLPLLARLRVGGHGRNQDRATRSIHFHPSRPARRLNAKKLFEGQALSGEAHQEEE